MFDEKLAPVEWSNDCKAAAIGCPVWINYYDSRLVSYHMESSSLSLSSIQPNFSVLKVRLLKRRGSLVRDLVVSPDEKYLSLTYYNNEFAFIDIGSLDRLFDDSNFDLDQAIDDCLFKFEMDPTLLLAQEVKNAS